MYTRVNDIPVKEDYLSYQKDGSLKSLRTSLLGFDKISLPIMLGIFVLLIIIFTIIFFFIGPSNNKLIFTLAGFGLGIIVSIIFWFLWGKNHVIL